MSHQTKPYTGKPLSAEQANAKARKIDTRLDGFQTEELIDALDLRGYFCFSKERVATLEMSQLAQEEKVEMQQFQDYNKENLARSFGRGVMEDGYMKLTDYHYRNDDEQRQGLKYQHAEVIVVKPE